MGRRSEVRLSDLPARARREVEAQLAAPVHRRKSGAAARGKGRWRCHDCGEEFVGSFKRTDKHADETGHARYDCVLV